MEYIDDECNQDHSHQNVDKAADIRGITSLGQQEPFQFFFSKCHLLGNKKQAGSGVDILPAFSCSI